MHYPLVENCGIVSMTLGFSCGDAPEMDVKTCPRCQVNFMMFMDKRGLADLFAVVVPSSWPRSANCARSKGWASGDA
jgi:hypothetical protein